MRLGLLFPRHNVLSVCYQSKAKQSKAKRGIAIAMPIFNRIKKVSDALVRTGGNARHNK